MIGPAIWSYYSHYKRIFARDLEVHTIGFHDCNYVHLAHTRFNNDTLSYYEAVYQELELKGYYTIQREGAFICNESNWTFFPTWEIIHSINLRTTNAKSPEAWM